MVTGDRSKVDYVVMVNGRGKALCEAKSPSVMKKVGELLPARGVQLEWVPSQSLVRRMLSKVSTHFLKVKMLILT